MNRRPLLVVSGWLVAALVATGAGVVVTTFLGDVVTGSATRALSPAEVRRALAAASPFPGPSASTSPSSLASPSRSPSATAAPSGGTGAGSGGSKVIPARGGVVVARCDGGLVTLQSWTPAQGYEVKDVERGPRDKVRVRFEGDDARTEIEIRCSGGRPVSTVRND
ncbi:hypothetical protein [Sphaerisporangium perillae]|uniref:hypothetical protein n=1 Tax=Sphaerisporangium perillae TaxID=2935860 RepID=UPI0020106350|nr:hypothetical protein [Sphaerisporangium perillae]